MGKKELDTEPAGGSPASPAEWGEAQAARYGLAWLLRMRWFAVLGQAATCALAVAVLRVDLPVTWLSAFMGVTVASNLVFLNLRGSLSAGAGCFWLLALDTVTLTAMLFITGGAHNPFSIFYLLHVALAALLLPSGLVWLILALSSLGFLSLFFSPFELQCRTGAVGPISFDLHLQGMLAAMMLCGAFLAYFVGMLSADLRQARARLDAERKREQERRMITGLGTLAAGVAHELATPLATIAVASEELARQVETGCHHAGCKDDARLIAEQVARCRGILSRLSLDALRARSVPARGARVSDLPPLIEEALAGSGAGGVVFEGFDCQSMLPCNPEPLVESISALVSNARAVSDQPAIVRASEAEGVFKIEVLDSGPGLSDEVRSKAGEPFFTTREPGEGMGLGLFLVRMFCESVGAVFSIENVKGCGARASISFRAGAARQEKI